MKFVKNSRELGAAVNRILSIYEWLVISSGTLESAVKLKRWREAVKEMREESVRAIADRTDNVPPMLIGVDKFIRWTDDIGTPGAPFPDWNSCLFPTPASIAGHPWLLTIESRFDATHAGWMVQLESPTADPVLVRVPMTPEPENQPVSNVAPSHPVSIDKGKGKALPAESQAIEQERTTQGDVNEDGESEVVEPDVQMDEETSEPVRGRSKKRARSQSESWPSSTRRKSQSWTKRSSRRDGEPKGEALIVRPPREAPQKHAVPPTIRAEPSTNTPLPVPPIPPIDPSNISYHHRLDDIIKHQDLIFGRVDEVDRWVADVAGRILVQYQDRMQALEGELADCWLTVGTLTHEIETLRASMHGAHPAQNTAPPPIKADLFDLFGPSTNNAATVEAEESIATQLQGLVFTATPSSQEMATSGWQDPSLAAPVEVDSSSMQVGSGSGAASTGNEEQGGTVVFADKH
ncbi:hypothetical protein PISMIDRAFT_19512 [Pisolithus microcarpus 441]|uniref:Uncharacterized protein n=1 Tax=Pisolithus microcarpus 441 TaxID=765257 RepID=A0A0C9YMI4_9AGAM|nr:hypothetical protein BKA83DRAFT_19512 [Pisolithus microcarpus]KIK11457.1 hypothetical protein PISMIDRAFT_19512 [Pisolithus microcarpus 441]